MGETEIRKVRIPWDEWTTKGGAKAQWDHAPEGFFPVSYTHLPDAMEVNYAPKAASEPAPADVVPAAASTPSAEKKTRGGKSKSGKKGRR